MRFAPIVAAASIAVSGVAATPLSVSFTSSSMFGSDLSQGNSYGAPIPPWNANHKPGWYYGKHSDWYPELVCLDGFICKLLNLIGLNLPFLHCPTPPPTTPPPSDGYTQTFSNLTGATQAADYLTYGLVDTVADCKAMCNSVTGCNFVNTYHDVNGKGGSTQLTCSLFSLCHDASDADNKGGQSQPDGSIDYITNSDGYCKSS